MSCTQQVWRPFILVHSSACLRNYIRQLSGTIVRTATTYNIPKTDLECPDQTVTEKTIHDIPGPFKLPLIGSAWLYFHVKSPTQIPKLNDYLHKTFGDIVAEKLPGNKNIVHLYRPEDFEVVYRNEGPYPIRGVFPLLCKYNNKYNNGLYGLSSSEGKYWKHTRSAVQKKLFRLEYTNSLFQEHQTLADELLQLIDSRKDDEDVVTDLNKILERYTLEGIATTCFKERLDKDWTDMADNQMGIQYLQVLKKSNLQIMKSLLSFPLYMYFETPLFKEFSNLTQQLDRFIEQKMLIEVERFVQRQYPHHESQCPHHESQYPHHESQCPHHESQYPHHESQCPHHESQYPHHESQCPHHESQYPHHESQCPHHESQYPHHESQCPHHESQCPHHESQCPHHQNQYSHYQTTDSGTTRSNGCPHEAGKKSLLEDGLLCQLLQENKLDKQEITTIIKDIIASSVFTLRSLLSFILYALTQHPEAQERLREEIRRVILNEDANEITQNTFAKMPYLKAFVKETLRYYPVIPGNFRQLYKEINIRGYTIPKGTYVKMHHIWPAMSEEFFENASEFKPNRWMRDSEEREITHPFAVMQFGFGPRSCLGKRLALTETYLFIIKILSKYSVQYPTDTFEIITELQHHPPSDLKFKFIDCPIESTN